MLVVLGICSFLLTAEANASLTQAPSNNEWGAALTLGGSLDFSAVAITGGARYQLDETWVIGLDGEWNPWFSYHTESA
jgi:hypothetical protein